MVPSSWTRCSVFIRQCLSRSLLKTLVRTSGIETDQGVGECQGAVRFGVGEHERQRVGDPPVEPEVKPKNRPAQLTDHEIEAAIIPLLDYLDAVSRYTERQSIGERGVARADKGVEGSGSTLSSHLGPAAIRFAFVHASAFGQGS